MITTSNFMMMTHIRYPISVALKAPNWYRGPTYKELSPNYNLLKEYKTGLIGPEEFRFRYEQMILSKLDPYEVLNEIKHRCNLKPTSEDDISLLSYERAGLVSHRTFIAEWLNNILPENEQIKELSIRDCMIDKFAVRHLDIYRG